MQFLAKHFFDYQSFINLPHTAVQMHKTPPSQAGTDPSAAWAPKDLHVAGKNQAAPAARANRNYHGDQRTGSHRHGRPSKLEFRNWGERHGELRAEKIVPHKDHWMETLEIGGGGSAVAAIHRGSLDTGDVENVVIPNEHFTRVLQLMKQQQQQQVQNQLQHQMPGMTPEEVELLLARSLMNNSSNTQARVLLILTVTSHMDFITVTVKSVRGLAPDIKDPFVQLRLFDGNRLIEERGTHQRSNSRSTANETHRLQQQYAAVDQQSIEGEEERELSQSFLLKAPPPLRLPFCHLMILLYAPAVDAPTTSSHASSATAVSNGIQSAQQQHLHGHEQQQQHCRIELKQQSQEQQQKFLLGTCLIGPSGTVSRTNSHWRQMIKKIGVPIAMWHDLVAINNRQQSFVLGTTATRERASNMSRREGMQSTKYNTSHTNNNDEEEKIVTT